MTVKLPLSCRHLRKCENIKKLRKSKVGTKYNHNILLVDDDVDVSEFFRMTLEYAGFNVFVFNDPLKALVDFKCKFYDLLLLDIKMRNITGFQLYYKLKNLDSSIKVCFITAFEPYYQSLLEQFNLDVRCFIKKPISDKELIKLVVEQLITTD